MEEQNRRRVSVFEDDEIPYEVRMKHGQGIAYEIVSRHPVQLARIADFRKE